MRFQKSPFSSRRKRSKILTSSLALSYRFQPSTLKRSKKKRKEKTGTCLLFSSQFALLKPFSKGSVFIGVFRRFSEDDRRKHVKKCAFQLKRNSVDGGLRFDLEGFRILFRGIGKLLKT